MAELWGSLHFNHNSYPLKSTFKITGSKSSYTAY